MITVEEYKEKIAILEDQIRQGTRLTEDQIKLLAQMHLALEIKRRQS